MKFLWNGRRSAVVFCWYRTRTSMNITTHHLLTHGPASSLSFLLIVAAASTACGRSEGAAQARGREPAARPIKTEAVRQESVHRAVEIVGTLAAEDEVTVSSQVEGIVRRVLADLGDAVKADQPLVEL